MSDGWLHPSVRQNREAEHMLAPDPAFTPEFVSLSELLGGDGMRIRCILRAFCSTAGGELVRLEAALHEGDGRRISEVAHRAATACLVVGETKAGRVLEAISAATDPSTPAYAMARNAACARTALRASIARVSRRLDAPDDSPEEPQPS